MVTWCGNNNLDRTTAEDKLRRGFSSKQGKEVQNKETALILGGKKDQNKKNRT